MFLCRLTFEIKFANCAPRTIFLKDYGGGFIECTLLDYIHSSKYKRASQCQSTRRVKNGTDGDGVDLFFPAPYDHLSEKIAEGQNRKVDEGRHDLYFTPKRKNLSILF